MARKTGGETETCYICGKPFEISDFQALADAITQRKPVCDKDECIEKHVKREREKRRG